MAIAPALKNPHPVLVLELVDRQKSGFILEGSARDGQAVHLDRPSWYRIPPTSHTMENGKPRAIRHIQGAPSIYVDEQDKAGFKFNARRDNIVFDKGNKTVVRAGREINMYDYLQKCEYNQHAPDPIGTENIVFKEIRAEEVAKADISILKYKDQANKIVSELYREEGSSYVFETQRLKVVGRVVGVDDQLSEAEILMGIVAVSERDPRRFVESIANVTNEYRMDIREAIRLGVLSMDGAGASLKSNGTVFLKFKKKNQEDRVEEVLMHFLFPEGAMDLKMMRIDSAAAREKLAQTA